MKNNPQFIVIHHSASGRDVTKLKDIDNWHKKRWPNFISSLGYYVGYHRVIMPNGKVHTTRQDWEEGAHTLTNDYINVKSIGICLVGNFETEEPTMAQLGALAEQVDAIQQKYGIDDKNVKGHNAFVPNLCPGKNLISEIPKLFAKEREHYTTKNKNDFRCLIIADEEIDQKKFREYITKTKKIIHSASNKKLVLSANVVRYKLPMWENDRVKNIARQNYFLNEYQAVIAVYKEGKYRQSYAQMNELDKDFGILINQSFEDTNRVDKSIVLVHEFMHAFCYMLGLEYVESVHVTPDTFKDDFELIGRNVEKLYYVRHPLEDSEPIKPMPITQPAPKPGAKTSEFWLTLLSNLLPIAVLLGYITPEEMTATQTNVALVVTGSIALVNDIMYIWSRARAKFSK